MKKFHIRTLGVLITDTKSLPLRVGTIGRTAGYAGSEPLKSYVGKKDLFGKKSRFTKSNIADALSVYAVLHMGDGSEQIPLVIIKNALIRFTREQKSHKNLFMLLEDGIYTYI